MIIIEGTDGLGKTTLAKNVVKQLGEKLSYRHMSAPPTDFDHLGFYARAYGPWVWDRLHLGAMTYGQVAGLSDPISDRDFLATQRRFTKLGVCTFVLTSYDEAMIATRFGGRSQSYSLRSVLAVNQAYRQLCVAHPVDLYELIVGPDDSIETLTERVLSRYSFDVFNVYYERIFKDYANVGGLC